MLYSISASRNSLYIAPIVVLQWFFQKTPETARAYANNGFQEKRCNVLAATKASVLFFAQAMAFAGNRKKCFGQFSSIGGKQPQRLLTHDRRNNVPQTMYV
ncbi:MAG: hypothetical protein MUD08_12785 [Cytophagales bacterium]|jgi:hypothetical protein|nr:hypothetical protein [Cytophagales bacterium]